ncbi:MAG: glycosyltransferase [Gemmatimonadaceae bacterium]|nr:glycosyltransferase [Gemmatimonadaceae bacterium]
MNLADALVAAGHRVVVWSSAFSHQERRHRTRTTARVVISDRLEYRLIPSPGYSRNVGPGRLWDHALLAANLKRELRHATPPDVCFIGYPPIETAAIMARWLRRRNVPSLLDVKDQWPTIFIDALPAKLRAIGRVALSPYFLLARSAMRDASGLSAMADGFLQWALDFAGRARGPADRVVPLTGRPRQLTEEAINEARQWWDARGVRDDGRPRFCFVGSQTRSFDFVPVAEAARQLAQGANGAPCDFVICGTGEESASWQAAAVGLPHVQFPGWVSAAQLQVLASRCTGFLAPYIQADSFERSIPNKVLDAFSLGLPLITPLRGEVTSLIQAEDVGLRYGTDAGRSLADCLLHLIRDPAARARQGANARALHERRFTFESVYGGLVRHLETMALTPRPQR